MVISRFVRFQLLVFATLTVIGIVWMGVAFVKVPQMLGVGRVTAEVRLPTSGGLYQNANVSYRGSVIGVVDEVRLTRDHAVAVINIDSDAKVPEDVRAEVHSMSAVGEQFIELTPMDGAREDRPLADGAVIPQDRTSVPQEIGPMLDQAQTLLASVDDVRLQRVLDEAFTSFAGTGDDLQRLVDSLRLLMQDASNNSRAIQTLIEQAGPLLATQSDTSDAIVRWTGDFARVTGTLREKEPVLRDVMRRSGPLADQVTGLIRDINPMWPLLMANLTNVGQVGMIYNASIEQLLVLYPPLVAALLTSIGNGAADHAIRADFNLNINDPPACTTGFLPGDQRRSPADMSRPVTPDNLFCKVPQDSDVAVRGVRNFPCMEYPGRRAPSPEACRTGYTPQGVNPNNDSEVNPNGAATGLQPRPAASTYDPRTGNYVAGDGRIYQQADLAQGARRPDASLGAMMTNGAIQ